MWIDPLSLLIGAGIPVFTLWINSKEKQKYFELEVKEKLRLLAAERRLEAHQKAFSMWWKLSTILFPKNDDEKYKIIKEARQLWIDNAIYLEKKTRIDFDKAISIASEYALNVQMAKSNENEDRRNEAKALYTKNYYFFHSVPVTIQKEVMLEPIRPELEFDAEGNKIEKKNKNS